MMEIPGQPNMGMLNLGDMLGKAFGGRTKTTRVTDKVRVERSSDVELQKYGCRGRRRRYHANKFRLTS